MAKNEQKRKNKLLKKKQRTNDLKKQRNIRLNVSNRQLILSAAQRSPWLGCYIVGDAGMYKVFAVRQGKDNVHASVFLVDTYCLGIKDASFIKDFNMEGLRSQMAEMDSKRVSPEHALKFIQEAIDYAKNIGFEPSPAAGLCKMIFGDTDPAGSTEQFVFGKNGKPCYISGPFDSKEKQQEIFATLGKLGSDQFTYITHLESDASQYLDQVHYDPDQDDPDFDNEEYDEDDDEDDIGEDEDDDEDEDDIDEGENRSKDYEVKLNP